MKPLTVIALILVFSSSAWSQDTAKFSSAPYYEGLTTRVGAWNAASQQAYVGNLNMIIYYKVFDSTLMREYCVFELSGRHGMYNGDQVNRVEGEFYTDFDGRTYMKNSYSNIRSGPTSNYEYILLYDFSLKKGDTLFHYPFIDSTKYDHYRIVDSVFYVPINNVYHRAQLFGYEVIVEGFGALGEGLNYLQSRFEFTHYVSHYCLPELVDRDSTILVNNFGQMRFDCEVMNVGALHKDFRVSNPAKHVIAIFGYSVPLHYHIYNAQGKELKSGITTTGTINIQDLTHPQMVFLELRNGSNSYRSKVLIQ